jgi:hypothetical protein
MLDPTSIAGALGALVKVLADLKPLLKRSRGTKRSLLLELQMNLRTIQVFLEGEVRAEDAVRKLETRVLKKALESGFDFASLKKGKVTPASLAGNRRAYHLAGWTTEQVLRHLYFKVHELEVAMSSPGQSRRTRKRARLLTVYSLLLAIHRHISS